MTNAEYCKYFTTVTCPHEKSIFRTAGTKPSIKEFTFSTHVVSTKSTSVLPKQINVHMKQITDKGPTKPG